MEYRHAFESCRSYNRQDDSISRTDLPNACQKCGLKFNQQFNQHLDPNPHSLRVSYEVFEQCTLYRDRDYAPTSPRPSSGSGNKHQRPPFPSSHHHSSRGMKHVPSPQGYGGYETREHEMECSRRPSHPGYNRQENRTPEVSKIVIYKLVEL
ncbi:hypothetical protein GBAR_LOCUS4446 [Geodia barretti]|uniref:Uncharacterized protein n=1 Tax=Geodia barretti TaxID=519541 RepID=A0AA35R6U0_GEOBA|nr:hypothetical protein GBAR_LOCUS4446 [Geodia barretti]